MTTQNNQLTKAIKEKKRKLDQRIESIGWALFLIWSGALLIAPDGLVPEGSWLIGTGLIIIASMGIRYLYGIRVDGFWTVLGLLALSFGIREFFRLNLPVFPVLLIIVGVIIIYKVFLGKIDHKEGFWKYCYNEEFWKYCWKGDNDEKA
jgi:hypothetical protein